MKLRYNTLNLQLLTLKEQFTNFTKITHDKNTLKYVI